MSLDDVIRYQRTLFVRLYSSLALLPLSNETANTKQMDENPSSDTDDHPPVADVSNERIAICTWVG